MKEKVRKTPEVVGVGSGKQDQRFSEDAERIDLGESGEKSKESRFSYSGGMGKAKRERAGGKNITVSLVLDYELDPL